MFYELNYRKIFFWFRVKCLKQGIKNRNSVLNRVGKSAIFVLNRVREGGAGPHLATQGYIEFPPPPRWGPTALISEEMSQERKSPIWDKLSQA